MKRILSLFFLCLCLQLASNEIDTWSSPTTISTTGVNSTNPVVGMDSSGNAVAAWIQNGVLVSKNKPVGSSWSSATTISGSGASAPQIVVDLSGNATVIWVEGGVVRSAAKPFGSAWGSATNLSGGSSSVPQIAVDADGDVVAVWITSGTVQSKTKLFGMSWSALPETLSGTGSAAPQVAIGANGDVVAVWHTLNGISSIYNVNAATKSVAGLWSTAALVSDPAINSVYPQAAVNSEDDAMAVWFTYESGVSGYSNVILQSSSLPSGGSWATPVNVSSPGVRNPNSLSAKIVLSDAGNAIAVWTTSYDGSIYSLESAFGNLQLSWSETVPIVNSLYAYAFNVDLNSIADALAVYMTSDTNDSPIMIKYIESHAGGFGSGSWIGPVTISSGDSDAFPRIATTIDGNNAFGAAVWTNYDGMNTIIQSSSGTGTVVLPPSGLSVMQMSNNFGTFVEYYNTISWTASPDPNLTGYAIYRNGVFINFLFAGTEEYVDNNAVQSGSVTYGISAFDSSGTESNIVTVSFP